MSGLLPAAVYGLEVPCGDVMIPAMPDFPASFRITMAAIDPSAEPEFVGSAIDGTVPRATLKLIRRYLDYQMDDEEDDDEDDDSEDENVLQALLNGGDDMDDEDEDSEDEEANGGPSDPSKSKKARKEAALESLKKALVTAPDDDNMDGIDGDSVRDSKRKGKGIANGVDSEDEDEDEDEDSDAELEELVICTLDTTQHYQTPLDITIGEDEQVFFKVSGTHSIHLTGNYVIPVDDTHRGSRLEDEEDEDYDLSPDEDELDEEDSDELDDIDDPRITELMSEDEEMAAPKLVTKGKKKRPASDSEEEGAGLDDIMANSLKPADAGPNGDVKMSKKQKKKLKNNAGEAAKAEMETLGGKKVQFAKNLEQGPTGTNTKLEKTEISDKKTKASEEKPKTGLGAQIVKGVKVDVKKLGSGPAAKKGNKVAMRYIGKLKDGKQFDSNKKGKPFTFKLGAGEVIQGWDIGVEGICAGGERRLVIPAHLAYGKKALPSIPSNSELTFDIKCLEIS